MALGEAAASSTLPETSSLPSAKWFTKCNHTGTRQTTPLPSAAQKTLGKIIALGKFACLVFFFFALGKQALCQVFFGTRQRNNFFSFPNLQTFSTLHIQHVVLHVKIWYIFPFVCYI
jgi:hypothetical protein